MIPVEKLDQIVGRFEFLEAKLATGLRRSPSSRRWRANMPS